MTTEKVGQTNEILLDGKRYPVIGGVTRQLVSVFPGKVVVGDVSRDSRPRTSVWSMGNWVGGIGLEVLEDEVGVDRSYWSTLDQTYPSHLVLPPRADSIPFPADAIDFKGFGYLDGELYGVFGTKIHMYDGASWTGVLHTLRGKFNDIAHIELGEEAYLVVAHEEGIAWSSDGSTWMDSGIVELDE